MAKTIPRETRREGQWKTKRCTIWMKGPKKRRESVCLMLRSYFSHIPSNVANMQIVRFNNNGSFEQASFAKTNFFLIAKVKAC
jgi:hypothetical protein